ncbi:uncharacterized protein HMPREF1120_02588 [Exophiala dermatitidis NIH/UT8656]|uniref:Uncharacterized protein n=1 Tax=Exophiala dermatitidis (strain ATCC 34100 / CBS 525.76 / NIH/UT8656) TaxID=858893 RepID=H6BPG0_EXODN|nr:uncharacterized protein HMPREF1120_02588 [Exophiala dermatitidis NIH/UT8656]EHY54419.1 hypothetical protein HMPREF1120_02588 [Exophiala dermatitidis NIH/UT8656]
MEQKNSHSISTGLCHHPRFYNYLGGPASCHCTGLIICVLPARPGISESSTGRHKPSGTIWSANCILWLFRLYPDSKRAIESSMRYLNVNHLDFCGDRPLQSHSSRVQPKVFRPDADHRRLSRGTVKSRVSQ